MVYYLSNTIFTQSLAVVLIERAGSQPGKGGSLAHRMLDMLRKPPIVGMAVSIVLLVLGLRPPELVMRFASQISGSVTPLALIYCGYIVYEVGLKNLRFLQGMPTMLVIRLIVSPLICAAFCLLGGVSGLAMRVFIVESSPACGQPDHGDGRGLWGRRGIRRHRGLPVHAGLLLHHPRADADPVLSIKKSA